MLLVLSKLHSNYIHKHQNPYKGLQKQPSALRQFVIHVRKKCKTCKSRTTQTWVVNMVYSLLEDSPQNNIWASATPISMRTMEINFRFSVTLKIPPHFLEPSRALGWLNKITGTKEQRQSLKWIFHAFCSVLYYLSSLLHDKNKH